MEDSWHKSELAGDAKTPGWNRPASREILSGASCSGSLLIRRKEGPGLCSGPECGPPPLSTLFVGLPTEPPFITSRGQKFTTEQQREGLLGFPGCRFCCCSELKLLRQRCTRGHREKNFYLHCIYFPLAFKVIKVMHLCQTGPKLSIRKRQGSYLWNVGYADFSGMKSKFSKFKL